MNNYENMKFSRLNSTRRLCLSTAMVIVAASSIGAKEYPDSVVLEEVEVSAAAQRNLKSPELGRISLSGDKMLRLPVMFGQPDFSYDFVYQQLARQINAVTPGWQPDAGPFPDLSDRWKDPWDEDW